MNKNVPKLRFKDNNGIDYPVWETQRFYEIILKAKLGGNYENSGELTENPLIKMGNLGRGRMIMDKIEYITKGSQVEETDLLNEGDLLFNTRNTLDLVGKVAIWRSELKKAYYNSNLLRLEFRKNKVANNSFMNYIFNSHNVLAQLKAIAIGTTSVAAIYTRDLNNIKFSLPCLEEQAKIANFLSNVDNIIEEQEGKVKDLEQYKKGMMQKIFKQEVRFKDDNGIDYSAWEEKKLGEITDIGTGSNDLQDKDNNGLYPFFVRSKNIERINQYTFDGEAILIPGDGNIGQIYHYINGKFAYHQRVYKISDFKKGVLGKYIYFYMSKFFLKEALKNSVKATVDSLRLPTLTGMLIKLPCLEEQRKIANFLSNIDNIIEEEKNKLEDLKLWKKGLLQQMFV